MSTIPRNQWYVAAYGREVGRELLGRTICGEPIVFYRTEDGEVDGACATAACTAASRCRSPAGSSATGSSAATTASPTTPTARASSVPGQTRVPRTARRARSTRSSSRTRFVWVWIGDPDLADAAPHPAGPVAGLARLDHRRAAWSRSTPGYGLLVDNLLDLSHETYLHGGYIGTPEVAETPITTEVDDERRHRLRQPAHGRRRVPAVLRASRPASRAGSRAGRTSSTTPPCLYLLHSRIAPVGVAARARTAPTRTPSTSRSSTRSPRRPSTARTTSGRSRATSRSTTRRSRSSCASSNRTVVLQDVDRAQRAGEGARRRAPTATRSCASTSTPAGWPPAGCSPGWSRSGAKPTAAACDGERPSDRRCSTGDGSTASTGCRAPTGCTAPATAAREHERRGPGRDVGVAAGPPGRARPPATRSRPARGHRPGTIAADDPGSTR